MTQVLNRESMLSLCKRLPAVSRVLLFFYNDSSTFLSEIAFQTCSLHCDYRGLIGKVNILDFRTSTIQSCKDLFFVRSMIIERGSNTGHAIEIIAVSEGCYLTKCQKLGPGNFFLMTCFQKCVSILLLHIFCLPPIN